MENGVFRQETAFYARKRLFRQETAENGVFRQETAENGVSWQETGFMLENAVFR